MKFNYKNIAKEIHIEFSELFSMESIEEMLFIDEKAYSRDSPISVGKRLRLNQIFFEGMKSKEETFCYSRTFDDGLNMWLADNSKGKSTIFKIIKFALTGNDDLQKDVKAWIQKIQLEFSLGENIYSCILKIKARGMDSAVYSLPLNRFEEVGDNLDAYQIFEGGVKDYESFMQETFFREFNYYSLKWTQKSSQKDSNNLLDSNASWSTYFKSIYLESKDYDKLFFGSQGELIFQMLLGLEYTYAINRLKIAKDHANHEIANLKQEQENDIKKRDENFEKFKNELDQIEKKIKILLDKQRLNEEEKLLRKQYSSIHEEYSKKINFRNILITSIGNQELMYNNLKNDYSTFRQSVSNFQLEIDKREKTKIKLKEYADFGIFFSNLEVKSCPHCDHEIESQKALLEKKSGKCRLCDNKIDNSIHNFSDEEYQFKIDSIEAEVQKLYILQYSKKLELAEIEKKSNETLSKIINLRKELEDLNLLSLESEMSEILNKLKTPQITQKEFIQDYGSLMQQKGALEKQIKDQVEVKKLPKSNLILEKIKIFEKAIENLEKKRIEESHIIIENLEKLILNQLHEFNLKNYEAVKIKPNFKIEYTKNNSVFDFAEITEGEQLRVKLAFYLSLMELDIEYKHSRHPRFIILDSPTKEEGDFNFKEGLKDALASIERRFSNLVQIFIGTASRDLQDVCPKEKLELREANEYLF